MTSDRTILITGVTGNQGGAVAQALEGTGFHLRGLTRMPDSERAKALARQGIDIVKGDLDNEATLRRALAGAWDVFGVQNAGEAGAEREEVQGKRLAKLAREAGVKHFVYTSVGSAHKQTGVPHFDSKWRIEETVRDLDEIECSVPTYGTFVRNRRPRVRMFAAVGQGVRLSEDWPQAMGAGNERPAGSEGPTAAASSDQMMQGGAGRLWT
jgi:uncharacterized protein YbjT (DUF2867 family)